MTPARCSAGSSRVSTRSSRKYAISWAAVPCLAYSGDMSAIPSEHTRATPFETGLAEISARLRETGTVTHSVWPLLAILTVFWCYVAISNVLYADSMQLSLSDVAPHRFAHWDARLLQHLFLYPLLVLFVWMSMSVGWRPAVRCVAVQLLFALLFSVLAQPALMLGERMTGAHPMMKALGNPMTQPWKFSWPDMFDAGDRAIWMASATSFLLTYGFGLALINGFALYQRFRDAQLRSAALERALTAAHLAALRMQLSPHTLFNLLHTIRGQIAWDPAAAQSMVVQLGDLLRRLLTAGEREYSRLTDELQFVRLYLELQQKRFADRLAVWIADVDHLPQLWVPSLILQPLVENAVVHGLAGHTGPVVIRVEVSMEGETLALRVVNTVAPDATAGREGIGIRNVRERLAVQFGGHAIFHCGELEPGIWIAEIRLPKLQDAREPRTERIRNPATAAACPACPDDGCIDSR
jgi:hypothetical protein